MLSKNPLYPAIVKEVISFHPENINQERKIILQTLIDYIQIKVSNQEEIRLNFICTHNSRRSHLSQIWAQTAASYFNIANVFCYSGGTEATALFPAVAKTLEQSGFKINSICTGDNPIYSIKYADNAHPIIGFSKKYNDAFNPVGDFVAILSCSSADIGCPFIAGAEIRIPLTFEDPKIFDNTAQENEKYQERSWQIATEMFYVFAQIKK
jgi:arsenate reductase